jgi:protein TonB
VFGVTAESVAQSAGGITVPVGNTLMTQDRTPAKPGPPPQPYASEGPPAFAPVSDIYVATFADLIKEVKPEYPGEARRLNIEAQVLLRVGVDRRGSVRAVRVIKKAGYGMDEAAVQAMWKFKFKPCMAKDGRAIDCQITYKFSFNLGM